MKKERLSREQIEDQEDLKAHIAVMNDPNTEWVEWNQAKDEIHRWRKQNGYEDFRGLRLPDQDPQ